jgi:hypothetical protein
VRLHGADNTDEEMNNVSCRQSQTLGVSQSTPGEVQGRGSEGGEEVKVCAPNHNAVPVMMGIRLASRVVWMGLGHNKTLREAIFKALAKALDWACQRDPRVRSLPSTKGEL